jgi:hypothetical protein
MLPDGRFTTEGRGGARRVPAVACNRMQRRRCAPAPGRASL